MLRKLNIYIKICLSLLLISPIVFLCYLFMDTLMDFFSDHWKTIAKNILILSNLVVSILIIGFVLLQRGEEGVFANKTNTMKTDNRVFFKATIITSIIFFMISLLLSYMNVKYRI